MSRPRSDDRRQAILSAATRVIATQGLSAPTAMIAKEAGVSNGSLFLYFDTKSTLHNELYLDLKIEMGAAAVAELPLDAPVREQVLSLWNHWLEWATAHPDKRRTLAVLTVSDDLTAETHQAASTAMSAMARLLERGRADGPMKDVSLGFVLTLATAIAEATIDAIIREPAEATAHTSAGFDAMWRMLAAPAPLIPKDRT